MAIELILSEFKAGRDDGGIGQCFMRISLWNLSSTLSHIRLKHAAGDDHLNQIEKFSNW